VTDFVADTHAIVWHLTSPRRLGRAARRAFTDADASRARCLVPVIALIEIALLRERKRIGIEVREVLLALRDHPGYAVLALDVEQTGEFAALVGVSDPMDRLVLAAALATRTRLVSVDGALDGYGVARIWD
jgi:PIN domain nuclease of toxin-antitoxin system